MKRYYAMSDSYSGDYPTHTSNSFANSHEVIFFLSARLRSEWLKETRVVIARALKRSEALKYSKKDHNGDMVARPVQNPGEEFAGYYEVIRAARTSKPGILRTTWGSTSS